MSGSANRWVLRLSTEGADQVIRDLRAAATESAAAGRAYDALIKAQPALATGAERAEQALRKNVDAMRGMRSELSVLGATTDGLTASLGRFGSALTSPAGAIAGLSAGIVAGGVAIARLGDEYTNTMNKLRAATGSVQAASAVYAELVAMSQQTGASISESAGAFVRFSVAARAIGATNGEVLQLTRTIQQAGLISGASTQEAAAGVQQLGQALASGTLQGDELRSILENMPTLAEALAQQLGVSIGQLRTMGSEGQLTSDRVFQALLRASENINKQFNELTPTMGRAFGVLGQAMVEFVGKLDQALGLCQAIARAATGAAAAVGRVSGGIGPRSPAEQAEFDVAQAQARVARLEAELASLSGEPGLYAAPRRGTISRGLQETAAQTQPREERLAELRLRIEAENAIIREGLARRNQVHSEADDVRQADEATAAARRLAAARAAQQTAFNSTRDALDQERKLRTEHATRITAIDAGLANGDTDAAGASRLLRMANDELADGLKALDDAARKRVETDQDLAAVSQIVLDIEKDRLALMRDGESVTQSVRSEAEKYAEELARLNNLLNAGAITQDTYNRAVAAADPAVKAATEASRRIEQENTRTTDRITSFFGDAFARAFEGTGDGFKGLMTSFKRAAISTFASIAAQAIIRPIIAPIVQATGLGQISSGNISGLFGGSTAQAATTGGGGGGGTGGVGNVGGFSTLRTAYNGLTSPGGLGSFFPGGAAVNTGWGSLDGVLNTSLVAPTYGPVGGFPDAAGFQSLVNGTSNIGNFPSAAGFQSIVDGTANVGAASSSGLTIASSLGPLAAIGGGAFGVYQGIQKGGVGGAVGATGGAVSAITGLGMLGSAAGLLPALGVLGPIGLGVGAVLAIAGALLPGAKPSGMGQLARTNLNTGLETTEGLGGKRFSQANATAAGSTVDSIVALAREVGDKLGGARIGGDVAVGVTNGTIYLDVNGQKTSAANTEQGSKDIAAAAARMVLNEFNGQGTVQGAYRGIVAASGDSLERLDQNLQWYERVYRAFDKTADAADKTAEAIKGVEGKFNPLIDKAHELGLSSDNLVAARAKEWEAAVKAVADAEKARQAELSSIRTTIQARLAASSDAADYEARLLAGQATRAQAWGEELRQLEQRLTALGETTEATAAQVGKLSEAQSAEYWRNFASSMDALDRSVIGRILRANGRTGAADRLDFEAGATAQIAALSKALAELGLSADIAAIKIAETQQAIDAERLARANAANDQILALDRSVISRILRATGRGNQADVADFEAAAAQEVKNLAKSLDDLGFSAAVIASKIAETEQALGAERIALQKRIAEEATQILQDQLRRTLGAGQSTFAGGVDADRDGLSRHARALPQPRRWVNASNSDDRAHEIALRFNK
ncbi:MAG: tape measure protein [Roseococcus sp.]